MAILIVVIGANLAWGAIVTIGDDPGDDYSTISLALGNLPLNESNMIILTEEMHRESNIDIDHEFTETLIIRGNGAEATDRVIMAETDSDHMIIWISCQEHVVFQNLTFRGRTEAECATALCRGAIYSTDSSVDFLDVHFEDNIEEFNYGGAISFVDSYVYLSDCVLTGNQSAGDGGAIKTIDGLYDFSTLELDNCLLQDNEGAAGGAVYVDQNSLIVNDCDFIGNHATMDSFCHYRSGGGAILLYQLNNGSYEVSITNTDFISNSTLNCRGGAIAAGNTEMVIDNCTFDSNSTAQDDPAGVGTAICWSIGQYSGTRDHNISISNSIFTNNINTESGGGTAIWFEDEDHLGTEEACAILSNCIIANNIAQEHGCIVFKEIHGVIDNCLFVGNECWHVIEKLAYEEPWPNGGLDIDNTTFADNTVYAVTDNAIIRYNSTTGDDSTLSVNNSILAHHEYFQPIHGANASRDNILYTNIYGNTYWSGSSDWDDLPLFDPTVHPNNMSADPKFVTRDGYPEYTENDNYSLRWDSPCLDVGDPDPDLRNQDHTRSDMGYREVYDPVLVTSTTNFENLEKGVYYATADVDADNGFKLPSGSILLLGSGVDVTVNATSREVFLGDQEDTERTVISYLSDDPENDPHGVPLTPRGDFSIGGSSMPPEGDFVYMNHLRYVHADGDLEITEAELDINDVTFCIDYTNPEDEEATVFGQLYIGNGCSGSVANCILYGSEANEQMRVMHADINISHCKFFDYDETGLFLLDYGHKSDYKLSNLVFSTESASRGIIAANSGFRMIESEITDHQNYGMQGTYAWFDMHRIAHNNIFGNSRNTPNNGQIFLSNSNCQLDCGANQIAYSNSDNDIILINDPNGLLQESTDVTYNDWGDLVVDPSNPRVLPTCWGTLEYVPLYDWTEWTPFNECANPNPPAVSFADGNWQEINGDIPGAIVTYNYIIKTWPRDPYASRAAFRLNYLGGKGYDEGMAVKAAFEETIVDIGDENPDMTFFLEGNYWVLHGELVNLADARSNLETLRDQATDDDAAAYYELRLAYLNMLDDTNGSYSEGGDSACQRVRTQLARQEAYAEQALAICGTGDDDPGDNSVLPADFSLAQNYPNPFNPVTTINYSVPETADLSLTVYNVLGQKIIVLAEGSHMAGDYTVQFDGSTLTMASISIV